MKLPLSQIPVGNCFLQGKKERKKVGDGKVASIGGKGRVSTRGVKGDPEVEQTPCSLRFLGVGLRRHPDAVVEIGEGNILRPKRRK